MIAERFIVFRQMRSSVQEQAACVRRLHVARVLVVVGRRRPVLAALLRERAVMRADLGLVAPEV